MTGSLQPPLSRIWFDLASQPVARVRAVAALLAIFDVLVVSGAPATAQSVPAARLAGEATPKAKEVNDGLDPTRPTSFAKIAFEHLELVVPNAGSNNNSNTFSFDYQQPFGSTALKFKLPVTSVDVVGNSGYGIGDVSLKLTHVLNVTPRNGTVLNFELVADSASRPELGTGKWVAKPGLIYAFFLDGGHILAPALFQSLSFAGDPNRADINLTTIDFYFVPKLANPKLFMTLDPAVNIDWRNDKQFVVTAVTLGYQLGPMLGGNGQMFVKPSVGLFSDKPTGWGIQLGFQVLGF